MPQVHPTAVVGPECELAEDVTIGPWCVLSGRVRLGPAVRLMASVQIQGPCQIGAGTLVYPFACIGFEGQDVKFKPGMPTAGVVIGAGGILREHVTVHAATKTEAPTKIGDRVFMLTGSHVGHDCTIGHDVVMVNQSACGGHVTLGDNVLLGGQAVIHQFVQIGRYAHVAGDCGVALHVPPFVTVNERNRIGGVNRVGLRRAGMPREHISQIVRAYHDLLRNPLTNEQIVGELRSRDCAPLTEMADFIERVRPTRRGICPGMGRPPRDAHVWFKNAAKWMEAGVTSVPEEALADDDETR